MLKKALLPALAAVALAVLPALGTNAAIKPHVSVVYNGITFTSGSNGVNCLAGTGVIIGVSGSSALKNLIIQAGKDYCTHQAGQANIDEVQYVQTDSCPGDVFASGDSTDPIVGVSDVFPGACAVEGISGVGSNLTDKQLNVNIVEALATCPGATSPQGGSVITPTLNGGVPNPCQGSGDPTSANPHMCAPDSVSTQDLFALYLGTKVGNFNQIGGCNSTISGTPKLSVQNRVSGSGTKVTFCFNVYQNAGQPVQADPCTNVNAATPATGTTDMLNDVCGNAYTGAAPVDGNYATGYATRSAVVKDSRSGAANGQPLAGCGVLKIGASDAYNRNCDPTAPSNYASNSPVSNALTCNGDIAVGSGTYEVWGYEHTVTNNGLSGSNLTSVNNFITFLYGNVEDTALTQKFGFMRFCQMSPVRGFDAGPYSIQTATC